MEKGIWKPAPEQLIIYDQTLCDNYACTWISIITAASNLTGFQLTDGQNKIGWEDFVSTGKFMPGQGAYVSDSAPHALAYFNKVTGCNLTGSFRPFDEETIYEALSSGCAATMGLRCSPQLLADAQDNAVIDNPVQGNIGHAVTLIKLNTMDDFLFKWLDNYRGRVYEGRPYNNICLLKLPDDAIIFQNWLYVIKK